jgi:hypothetical protein
VSQKVLDSNEFRICIEQLGGHGMS